MAWIRIESSVARNRKFVKAGPAPSWLWLCGLAYCQEGLTDGFIATEALPYLGVKNAAQLAEHLVRAGLWDVAEGGWNVHDYLEHNRSAADVDAIRAKRGSGGKLGGRPKKNLQVNLTETFKVSHVKPSDETSKTHAVDVVVDASVDVVVKKKEERLDVAFLDFQAAYPGVRRKGGFLTQQAFLGAVQSAGSAAALMTALANHKASEQWSNPRLIPGMDVWLTEERWRQDLPAAGAATASAANPKTAGNIPALQRFIDRGRTA